MPAGRAVAWILRHEHRNASPLKRAKFPSPVLDALSVSMREDDGGMPAAGRVPGWRVEGVSNSVTVAELNMTHIRWQASGHRTTRRGVEKLALHEKEKNVVTKERQECDNHNPNERVHECLDASSLLGGRRINPTLEPEAVALEGDLPKR